MTLSPTPLFFQAPRHVVEEALRANSAMISPDFLCFETIYQAVAMTWPKSYSVVDIGGCYGIQGWLFRDFDRYVCVDSWDMHAGVEGMRARLPENGLHVVSDGFDYMRSWRDFGSLDEGLLDEVVFVCSGVPDERLREVVMGMRNSVVWYPSLPGGRDLLFASGERARETVDAMRRLCDEGWHEKADAMVWDAVKEGCLDQ